MNTLNNQQIPEMRFDLQVIASWIEPEATVLDLGCGNGDLLAFLKNHKQVSGTGIEQAEEKVARCIERGLTVLQGDFRFEVSDYPEDRFDVVILSQTLQQIRNPKELLVDLLRIGKRVIVSFPNFAHWSSRLQFFFMGTAPVNKQLPYQWYDTPNIRVISIRDFKTFLRISGVRTAREIAINTHSQDYRGKEIRYLKNLRATYGIMMLERVT